MSRSRSIATKETNMVANHRTRAQRGVDPRYPIRVRVESALTFDPVRRDSLYIFRFIVGDDRAKSADKALKALTRLTKKALL